MKTQLLEDIGQSAAIPLASSNIGGPSTASKAVQDLAPTVRAQPARPRSALGVWRQKPADEPLTVPLQPPDQPPAALDLHDVFEEIAALEAQFVPPGPQQAPDLEPAAPGYALPTPPTEPLQRAIPPADARLDPDPTRTAAAPQAPLFDFTPPSPALPAAGPFTPAGPTRSTRRPVLWSACLLALAVLIGGGRWWYQERSDAESLARIAAGAKEIPQAGSSVPRQAAAAPASPAQPGAGVRAASPAPAIPSSPAVPPLVMLEPDPPAASSVERRPPPAARRVPASSLAKRPDRVARAESGRAAAPAKKRERREPARPVAPASAIEADKPPGPNTTTAAALLKACRERGYHAAQCIKRGCSVTEYGFVCRGR